MIEVYNNLRVEAKRRKSRHPILDYQYEVNNLAYAKGHLLNDKDHCSASYSLFGLKFRPLKVLLVE